MLRKRKEKLRLMQEQREKFEEATRNGIKGGLATTASHPKSAKRAN